MRRKLAALLLAARSSAHINHDCTPSTRRLLDGVKVELRNVDDVWGRRVDGVTGESSRRASRRVGPGRLPCRRLDAVDWAPPVLDAIDAVTPVGCRRRTARDRQNQRADALT